ncbi:hypothetical protein [Polyangium sp. 6x1]|uniref:hypothetical protein n=1 Tax=Polyangium sp. 6x1 TaxID=3042689 RepID=UPI0024822B50|nr:hypothetical protein [Polyangium sp. 6x1]MDI1442536.1 hypothetical protein [Polyangium sp. 6x1]
MNRGASGSRTHAASTGSQTFVGPQGVAAPQSGHPVGPDTHVCSPSAAHCVDPSWQRSTQTQAPFEHVIMGPQDWAGLQSVQPVCCISQVCTPSPEHCVAPSAHSSEQRSTQAPPEHSM